MAGRADVAVLGFGISAFLAYLKILEWRAKPDLRVDMDWIVGGGGTSTLRLVAENRGSARGGVRNLVFSPGPNHDPTTSFVFYGHLDQLPEMLEPRAFARFAIELDPNLDHTFTKGLLGGQFTHAILIDQDGKPHAFPIPAQPTDGQNRV